MVEKLLATDMPLQKLLASKFIVEKGSAKPDEHVINFLPFHLRPRQSKNTIAGILDAEFKTRSLLQSPVTARSFINRLFEKRKRPLI